jgi:sterol desaturase/sphingolipid hydroxylase (fatty acid hydroxylase superfamily)
MEGQGAMLLSGSLAAVALWETARPRRKLLLPALRRRLTNIAFLLVNTTMAAAIFVPLDQTEYGAASFGLPPWAELVIGFLFLDLALYVVHRLWHSVPALWCVHVVHHSDPDVDWSSSVRHHPIEYLINAGWFWLLILVIGIPAWVGALYGSIVFVHAAAAHGNVRWPAWLERVLQPIMITLDAHLVHHSAEMVEADSNFGAVLSVWDRLFGTYRRPERVLAVFGVREIDPYQACRPATMLLTPFNLRR